MSDLGAGLNDLASVLAAFSDRVENPYTRSTQFYSGGESSIRVPPGGTRVRIFKGPEYRVAIESVEVPAGNTTRLRIALDRWIDMPAAGWYGADDHLHIPRPVPELNPYISRVLQAEDLHVGNLLLMGKVRNFTISPQHAHGPASYYQEGNYILATGQENPRTHFLGHTITLGARTAISNPAKYLIYRLVWEEAARQGALNGFAHANFPDGGLVQPQDGMAVVLPHDLLHFVEVLQFNSSDYEAWYNVLALGFRVAPTAGTDYPCVDQTIPGHERFYTRVEGDFTYENWLDGVRNHRTFVTTGPMAEFSIDGQDIGGEVFLDGAGAVAVRGRVVFDPQRDDISVVELVHNGLVVDRFSPIGGASSVSFSAELRVEESSWFALRAYGETLLENTIVSPTHMSSFDPTTNVHTAPIWVTLRDHTPLEQSTQAKAIAQYWLARLENMERVLAPENMEQLADRLERPNWDAVPRETLFNNREDLLREIQTAKQFFAALLR
ncbi:MAG TPA: CehA/McbA family metallohydrolase [Longimicrobiales bacterium]|nr:CehA/McbA family metallohydrolase [Longimicrobiales bacterium]